MLGLATYVIKNNWATYFASAYKFTKKKISFSLYVWDYGIKKLYVDICNIYEKIKLLKGI